MMRARSARPYVWLRQSGFAVLSNFCGFASQILRNCIRATKVCFANQVALSPYESGGAPTGIIKKPSGGSAFLLRAGVPLWYYGMRAPRSSKLYTCPFIVFVPVTARPYQGSEVFISR